MMMMVAQQDPKLLEMTGTSMSFITQEIKKFEGYQQLKQMSEPARFERDRKRWNAWVRSYKERLTLEIQGDEDIQQLNARRVAMMNANNPQFILRQPLSF
jgi:uncharacterized protein YdiU (UPF0061 family)